MDPRVKVRDQDLAEAIAKRRLGLLHQVGGQIHEFPWTPTTHWKNERFKTFKPPIYGL